VSQAFADLDHDPCAVALFGELHIAARERSTLLDNPLVDRSRHFQVEALRNLANFHPYRVRRVRDWPGARGSMYRIVRSLAHHLLGRFRVPPFLDLVWFGGESPYELRKRGWVVAHARGARFRGLDLPMLMTRRMEHLFLTSPDHLPFEAAMRRAELLTLGAGPGLVDAVLTTRLGRDLSHGTFWRTAVTFLVRHRRGLDLEQVGPIIGYLHGVRFLRTQVETATGLTWLEPPRPDFSLKGRTMKSLMRLVDAWHRALGEAMAGGRSWPASPQRPYSLQEPPRSEDDPPVFWEIVELTSSEQLRAEGRALRHCVATYSRKCAAGQARIWSLRRRVHQRAVRSMVTIEVDPRRRCIVQARGTRNRVAQGKHLRLIQRWAKREGLRVASLLG